MPNTAGKLAQGSNALGYELYRKLGPGDVEVSPASISVALAMALSGAKAETAAQMKATMHLEAAPEEWGALAAALQDRGSELRIANRLFAEKTYKLEEGFVQRTTTAFHAPIEGLDFKTKAEPSRVHINGWTSDQTKNRIKDLIPAGSVTSDTRLALVNAIYFLSDWAEPFDKDWTRDEDFRTRATRIRKVRMMNRTGHLRSGAAGGAHIVELPYKGETLAMTVIVPDKVDGLGEIEQKLSTASITEIDKALTTQNTRVSLPKFTIDPVTSLSLGDALVGLGMKNAFDRDTADFTGIANPASPAERLYIAKVFHKAFVKVDEKGTEAAAATAVMMAQAGGPPPAMPFAVNADRPFLFLVRDRSTGLVLFIGRVAEPKS